MLNPTTGKPFRATCKGCDAQGWAGDKSRWFADPEGEAFQAYYCPKCAWKSLALEAKALRQSYYQALDAWTQDGNTETWWPARVHHPYAKAKRLQDYARRGWDKDGNGWPALFAWNGGA